MTSSMTSRTAKSNPTASPDWLSRLTSWSLAGLIGFGVSSLVLSMIGLMRPWIAVPVGVAASLLASRWVRLGDGGPPRPAAAAMFAAVVIAVASIGLTTPHQHILATRDSGTYVATAAWVAETGSLRMNVGSELLDGIPVVYESLGFQAAAEPQSLMPQFLHLFPSLLALVASTTSSLSAMYLVNPIIAVIGLLCLFQLARSLSSPWLAVLAVTALAASMPFLYFSRAPFTEALAFTAAFGGLAVAHKALADGNTRAATGSGLLFGLLMLTRIDGVVLLLGLTAYRTLLQLRPDTPEGATDESKRARIQVMDRVVAVTVGFFALAMLDAALFSMQYLIDHGRLVAMVLAATLIVTLIGRSARKFDGLLQRRLPSLANAIAVILAVYLGYAWILRPGIESPTRSDIYGIAGLQRTAGVAVEPLRSYAELSVHWLVWYLGIPLVLVGLGAMVWLLRRAMLDPANPTALLSVVSAIATVLYIYRPSINPDHIWAMRRFVPLVMPALTLLAVVLLGQALPHLRRSRFVVVVVAVMALVTPILRTTATPGLGAEFDGAVEDLEAACQRLGDNSLVLFVGEASDVRGDALGPPLRGFCNVAVAVEDPANPIDESDLEHLHNAAATTGTTVWLVGDETGDAEPIPVLDATYQFLELTLFEAPQEFLDLDVRVSAERLEG